MSALTQPIPITILTDHKALQYFKEPQKLNRRQARWLLYLSRFNFVLQHRPGKSSAKPDALSRRADHDDGSKDNEDIVFLPEKYFIQSNQWFPGHYILRAEGPAAVLVGGEESEELLDRIRNVEEKDEAVVKAVKELKSRQDRTLRGEEWKVEEDGLI